jgi:large subunit ribosomal protein L24
MSQLAKAPLRTAKRLQKVKEMKKVMTAIKWHERARKERQELMSDHRKARQVANSLSQWKKENVTDVKRRVLREAREDWKLGPLRPNRAVGDEVSTYGTLDQDAIRRPLIPARIVKERNEKREKRGEEPEYPMVVDDKKYFHIVVDDRVTVIRGREKGKIGIVGEVLEGSHEVIIKDLNKVRGLQILLHQVLTPSSTTPTAESGMNTTNRNAKPRSASLLQTSVLSSPTGKL